VDYAKKLEKKFKNEWFRVNIDDSSDSFSKKIRNWEIMKIPYSIIVWEKEETWNILSIREYSSKKQYEIDTDEFINECKKILDK
jgi:threonyl-tRNA synthetase